MSKYFDVLDKLSQIVFFVFATIGMYAITYLIDYSFKKKLASGLSFLIIFLFVISLIIIIINKIQNEM